MASDLIFLIPLFFLIALFYSAAGFGGGSSYLAILALSSMDFLDFRAVALLCNIAVVSGSAWLFYKHGFLNLKKSLSIVIVSVPLAFLGGTLRIQESTFFLILGFSLFIASVLMLFTKTLEKRPMAMSTNTAIGGGIGFLSGIVGIGGGIFLSPVLHLSKWDFPKSISATTSFFILVNSVAGLLGQLSTHRISINPLVCIALLVSVIIGGQLGSRMTISRLNSLWVRRITAILIFLVSMRILNAYYFTNFI